MGSPTPPEVSLRIEIKQLRDRIAELEQQLQAAQEEHRRMLADLAGEKAQAGLMADGDQSLIQQNRLRAVLQAIPVGVALLDSEGGMIESNAAFERIWGGPRPATRSVGDYAGYKAWWADGKPVQPEDWAAARAVQKGETVLNQEMQIERFDGARAFVMNSAAPIRDAQGRISGSAVVIRDITERKQAQIQLIESQRLAKVGSWELDIATGRTRWSDEWYRIFGLSKDVRADFQTFLSCVHPKDRGLIIDAQKKSQSTSGPFNVEYRIIRPDGELRFIRSIVEGIKDDEGTLVRLHGAAQDVTDEVRATELLRESEARLKSAERITHVGHWTWNIKTNRAFWSEEVFRIMGQPQDYEPDYQMFLQVVAPGDRDRLAEWVQGCLSEKRGSVIEYRVARPGGGVRTVACTSEVLLDDYGSPELFFGAVQDVTDLRRAQEDSFAMQKLESLGTLAGGIAHDFNNLLGAVSAQAELAMAQMETGSHATQELKHIRDITIRGAEIVRQLMIYAGQESDVLEPVDLTSTVEEMLPLLAVCVSGRATLVTDFDKNLPAVKARTAQIRQIVMNLVVNASDAIQDHDGVIRVTTQCVTLARETPPRTEALAPGEYVQLEVSDTGTGMSPELQARIFDPFFSTKSAGRGLGLPVLQGIVRSLRGAIRVDSRVGKGTAIQILLPSWDTMAHSACGTGRGSDREPQRTPHATVLLVEDEAPIRFALTKMLEKAGFAVLEAADGFDAIQFLHDKSGRIDVLFLDMTIPGCSSHQVLSEAVQAYPQVKVILTSAYGEEMVRANLSGPQICGFVRKPFQIGTVISMLRNALSS
jgi:two-component system, cell cycle sensor histidine kinase and response regulator CckA